MQTRIPLKSNPRCPSCHAHLDEITFETTERAGPVVHVAACPFCRSILGVSVRAVVCENDSVVDQRA